jgi:hypothetical protein
MFGETADKLKASGRSFQMLGGERCRLLDFDPRLWGYGRRPPVTRCLTALQKSGKHLLEAPNVGAALATLDMRLLFTDIRLPVR